VNKSTVYSVDTIWSTLTPLIHLINGLSKNRRVSDILGETSGWCSHDRHFGLDIDLRAKLPILACEASCTRSRMQPALVCSLADRSCQPKTVHYLLRPQSTSGRAMVYRQLANQKAKLTGRYCSGSRGKQVVGPSCYHTFFLSVNWLELLCINFHTSTA
jgi:hypothetical protein